MKRLGNLPKKKRNAIFWIRVFQRDLKLPRGMYSVITNIDYMARYKLSICALLSHVELNIKKEETDLNETQALINCIKRTLPSQLFKHCQRQAQYLDSIMDELKSEGGKNV